MCLYYLVDLYREFTKGVENLRIAYAGHGQTGDQRAGRDH